LHVNLGAVLALIGREEPSLLYEVVHSFGFSNPARAYSRMSVSQRNVELVAFLGDQVEGFTTQGFRSFGDADALLAGNDFIDELMDRSYFIRHCIVVGQRVEPSFLPFLFR
jgi:hypothetical protein